jgi:hypothetical protein
MKSLISGMHIRLLSAVFAVAVSGYSALASVSFSSTDFSVYNHGWPRIMHSYSGADLFAEDDGKFHLSMYGCTFDVPSKNLRENKTDISTDEGEFAVLATIQMFGFSVPSTETFYGFLRNPRQTDITQHAPNGFECSPDWNYVISILHGSKSGLVVVLVLGQEKKSKSNAKGLDFIMTQDAFSPKEWERVKKVSGDLGLNLLIAASKK